MLREQNLQPRILYPRKLAFTSEKEIKTFGDKQKLREFVASRAAFIIRLKTLKEVLERERRQYSEIPIYIKKGRPSNKE